MEIGIKLLELRQRLNFTQEEMVKGVLSVSSLSRIERNINSIVAEDLIDILEENDVSIVGFLREFSSIHITFREYQRKLERCFQTQDLEKLHDLIITDYFPTGILNYLACDMASVLEGETPSYALKIRLFLKQMNEKDELFLWSLLQCLKVYPTSLFAELVEKVLASVKRNDLLQQPEENLVDEIMELVLEKDEDKILCSEAREVVEEG